MLRSCYHIGIIAGLWVLSIAAVAHASRPSETLLPNTTKGFLSVGNFDQLRDSWNKTQLGQLMQDPVMKPFTDDLKRQFQAKWSKSHQQLGLSWEDLEGIPTGEVAVGVVQPAKGEAALAVLVDITGHEAATEALIDKISKKLTAQQAKRTTRQVRGITITQFDTAKTDEKPATHAAFFTKDGLLVASDNAKVLDGILARMAATESADSLAGLTAFSAVMKRCQTSAGETVPHIRWFLEPFGYVETVRVAIPPRERRKGLDLVKILKNQGFTAVQGLGGYVNFSVDRYEMLHRTAIYAPAVKQGTEKYELAARMLDFPAGGKLEPQSWIPRELATYASFHWNIPSAFEASSTLVDEIVGEKVFEDILTSMQEDPNGPQIDIRKDLIGRLGTRATVISDYKLPITPKSERVLVAIEATDVAGLAETIEKAMKSDENAKRREFQGHVIWEIIAEDQELAPMVSIEANAAFGAGEKADETEEQEIKLPNSAVTVAHGHLLVSTHIDFLEKVLCENESLTQSTDYQIVHAELEKLTGSDNSVHAFSRTDEEYRAVYELIRTEKMPEAETMLGRVLNAVLGDGKKGALRTQKIDGHSLPEYDAVRRYFGPAGLSVISEKDGWFVMGFTMSKQQGMSSEGPITTAAVPTTTSSTSSSDAAPAETAE